MKINARLTPKKLSPKIDHVFEIAAHKVAALDKDWNPSGGTPVFTVRGKYTSRGWTEWTQGFQFGNAILVFDATGDETMLKLGRERTVRHMASHVSHTGVHDHGFNNVSTYGNLRRLMREGRMPFNQAEMDFYELALKASGAVQAARWSTTAYGTGYIYSFNGPHSLFSDTIRSLRALVVADRLGHVLMGEGDKPINLLARAAEHAKTTARFNVYYGEGRDSYDVGGRVVHESIFNCNDGNYRCPSTQQGYSPFTTWTRGASWIISGAAEQLEFLQTLKTSDFEAAGAGTRKDLESILLRMVLATSDHYIDSYSCVDGIPYWDDGAPNIHRLGDYRKKPADPFNEWEPVDSSAAAIAAQGFVRLGNYLASKGDKRASRYLQAGLTVAATLFEEPYLASDRKHQGLLLHSVYHRPNGWDFVPRKLKVPCGESSMWGDYHLLELALLIKRMAEGREYLTFF
ncbi:MAG TPA: glycosyl hydrolase [Opitutaceae bacterium]